MQRERLSIKQTATGYWVVRRGGVQLAGAVTRKGAEAELRLLERLRDRGRRRLRGPRALRSSFTEPR